MPLVLLGSGDVRSLYSAIERCCPSRPGPEAAGHCLGRTMPDAAAWTFCLLLQVCRMYVGPTREHCESSSLKQRHRRLCRLTSYPVIGDV